ncbi:MAG: DUF445 domain-containing protein [Sulfobacillus acidophilus]|uniref:DUF445 domain-containing protein n=1 Tax=Sulfobacillus acidophilus TaxID=53633 RepID=A0A2T2WG61_9FIRM|nr:MAG: DUF445 domain-containing protein [Sulfobacillus acidophilus]
MQRRWANVSLLALIVLLLTALVFHHTGWSPYLLGLALAGLAGGIADWYAVTALFRHPLGMKWLPHTSIISANRDRIIEALATLVETELLSSEFLNANIQKLSVSQFLIGALDKPLSPDIGRFFSQTAADWVRHLDDARLAVFVERMVRNKADDVMISDWAVRLIEWLIRSGNDRALFLFLSEQAEIALDQVELTEDLERRLREMIEDYTKTGTQKFFLGVLESLGTVDYHELTTSIKAALKRWLASDSAFEQFDLILMRIMRSLRDDAVVRARVEEAKMGLLGQIPWEQVVAWARTQAVEALEAGRVTGGLQQGLKSARDWLESEPGYQAQLDALARGILMKTATDHHSLIGRLVRDNLQGMDEREWIDKLEFYVGRDLQWIRINGAVVGALVGLLITVLTHL